MPETAAKHQKPISDMDFNELQFHFRGHTRKQLLLAIQAQEKQMVRLRGRLTRLTKQLKSV